jgi:hypothetical protein
MEIIRNIKKKLEYEICFVSQYRNSYVEEVDRWKIMRTKLELKYIGKKHMG